MGMIIYLAKGERSGLLSAQVVFGLFKHVENLKTMGKQSLPQGFKEQKETEEKE